MPVIDTVETSPDYICANVLWPGDMPSNANWGFQSMLCKKNDFLDAQYLTYTDYSWNNNPYGKLSYFYKRADQYIRVRAYHLEGNTVYYGPWTTPFFVEEMDPYTPAGKAARYNYSLYYLSPVRTYSDLERPVYIRTENPNPNSIELIIDGKSSLQIVNILGKERYYDDVEYLCISDTDAKLQKVEGGYIGFLKVAKAGNCQLEVWELSSEGYAVAKTVPLEVLDYEKAREAEFEKIIGKNTNPTMNPLGKMRAVVSALEDGTYRYLTRHDGEGVQLAAQPNTPWFVVKRWDSATSPAMLRLIAERIGGLENIHGGSNWDEHAYAFMTYDGNEYAFTVCPSTSTGEVEYQTIDFTDPDQLYPFQ